MRTRLINAIKNVKINSFLNDPLCFPMLLKGGYEDIFSMMLFLQGFQNNSDLITQYHLGNNNMADIISKTGNSISNVIEFGHQFSLQFPKNSGLKKLKTDARKRLQDVTKSADLYTVQIITDVININAHFQKTSWYNYYANRYLIQNSISNRNSAINRINQIKSAIDNYNLNHGFNPQLINLNSAHEIIKVKNNYGVIDVNFIVNGPYNFIQRKQI